MPDETLLEKLRATRDGYEQETEWHRFLLDAYTGCGGFHGRVKPPDVGYWGWASEAYGSPTNTSRVTSTLNDAESYLDRFPREDEAKFRRRIDVAHYANYIEPIQDLLVSYVLKPEMVRENIPDELLEWRQDVDQRGTTWDELAADVMIPRTASVGWTPVLFDMPISPATPITRAAARELGLTPRMIPLFPANLLQWSVDDAGNLRWAKIRTDYVEHEDPLAGKPVKVERYTIWYPDRAVWFEVRQQDGASQPIVSERQETPHAFGMVPIAIWRHRPDPEDPIRGLPMIGSVAIENRRLFNLVSELDEHLRGQVFAILQVPVESLHTLPSEVTGGVHNALPILKDSSQPYAFIAPPSSVAETYEARIEATIKEMYRIARVEYTRPTGAAVSGVSKQYEFEQTNRRLGDFAKQLARAELWSLQIVGRALGIADDKLEEMRVTAPQDFAVEDMLAELEKTVQAIGLGLGPTATKLLKRRAVDKLLPNLDDETAAQIDEELEEASAQEANMAATQAEMDEATKTGQPDDEPAPEDEGDTEDGDVAA